MKQKELMRNKALYDALEELDAGGVSSEDKSAMVAEILSNHCHTDNELYWQVELFQSSFRLVKQARTSENRYSTLEKRMEKTKQFIATQFNVLKKRKFGIGIELRSRISQIKTANQRP